LRIKSTSYNSKDRLREMDIPLIDDSSNDQQKRETNNEAVKSDFMELVLCFEFETKSNQFGLYPFEPLSL